MAKLLSTDNPFTATNLFNPRNMLKTFFGIVILIILFTLGLKSVNWITGKVAPSLEPSTANKAPSAEYYAEVQEMRIL